MKTSYLFEKAQSQLIDVRILVQAEGWDKDPDYIKRDKGRFSSNNTSNKIASDKDTASLVSSIQSDFQKLTSEQKNVAENATNLPVFDKFKSSIAQHLSSFSTEAANVYNKSVKDVGNAVDPKRIIASIEKTKKYYNDNPVQLGLDGAKAILHISTVLALVGCLYCASGSVLLATALATGTTTFSPEILAYSLAILVGRTASFAINGAVNAISLAFVSAIDKQSEEYIKQQELMAKISKEFEDSRKTFPTLIPSQYLKSIK